MEPDRRGRKKKEPAQGGRGAGSAGNPERWIGEWMASGGVAAEKEPGMDVRLKAAVNLRRVCGF
jgi:hypothetical protein